MNRRRYHPVRYMKPPVNLQCSGCCMQVLLPLGLLFLFLIITALPSHWLTLEPHPKRIYRPHSDFDIYLQGLDTGRSYEASIHSPTLNLSTNDSFEGARVQLKKTSSVDSDNLLSRIEAPGLQPKPNEKNLNFVFIRDEPDKCRRQAPFLVLLVSSAPKQFEARQAIRDTWGNESLIPGVNIVRLFLLGSSPSETINQDLDKESHFHDIIQQNFLDTYHNLTIKTVMGLQWLSRYCPTARYVMKTDSDMFVNIEFLVQSILRTQEPPRKNYFTGYLMRDYSPNRNPSSKWYMSRALYPGDRYPTFCSGTGYIFSGDLSRPLYQASLTIRILHLEDVYVGLCLAKLHISPVPPPNDFDFNHWHVSYSACRYSKLVTSHQFRPGEIRLYWEHLQQNKANPCFAGKNGL
uniref:beta-1,3-galactosyltransferase 2-like n=1 Tax=Myxine glutinosa TaxID=7769 RepID=UPI00358EDDD0